MPSHPCLVPPGLAGPVFVIPIPPFCLARSSFHEISYAMCISLVFARAPLCHLSSSLLVAKYHPHPLVYTASNLPRLSMILYPSFLHVISLLFLGDLPRVILSILGRKFISVPESLSSSNQCRISAPTASLAVIPFLKSLSIISCDSCASVFAISLEMPPICPLSSSSAFTTHPRSAAFLIISLT